jgi:hypothetical protein
MIDVWLGQKNKLFGQLLLLNSPTCVGWMYKPLLGVWRLKFQVPIHENKVKIRFNFWIQF